jgi:hypothetical protein
MRNSERTNDSYRRFKHDGRSPNSDPPRGRVRIGFQMEMIRVLLTLT